MTTPRDGPHGDRETAEALAGRLRQLDAAGFFDLPQPGTGHTAERLRRLADCARQDLALARIAEAHLDAVTILREAGRTPRAGALYGVWASDAPHARLTVRAVLGGWELAGRKAFCTGAGIVDRALVTVAEGNDVLLVDVPTHPGAIEVDTSGWITPAFATTNTATIAIAPTTLDADAVVGPPGWYLSRIGFWHGALAPAACWAGGAIGLAHHCTSLAGTAEEPDDHTLARLGSLDASCWELAAVLSRAGEDVDRHPASHDVALDTAYRCRTVVERAAAAIIDDAIRLHGPRLLAFDGWAQRRIGEVQLYIRQHHDRRDHATLGRRAAHRAAHGDR